MKISKLFHWLYALVMLLPIFAIGVTCAYVIFNKNAYQSYSGENEIRISNYESTSNLPLEETIYSYINSNTVMYNTGYFRVEDVSLLSTNQTINNVNDIAYMRFYGTRLVVMTDINYTTIYSNTIGSGSSNYINMSYSLLGKPQADDLGTMFSYIETYSFNYIDNVFYYSIDKVEQSPLFSWSYDSFLATPITYISDLFGIASTHPVVLLMSYWLAISIIWLVFDLVMYMPLLVHRWLDKGVLE